MNSMKSVKKLETHELRPHLYAAQRKLFLATRQINHLDNQISYLRKLFRRAEKNNGYAVRYNLRMQLSISSGVKVMYHHYAAFMENRIAEIRTKINDSYSSSSPTSDETVDDRT
ncbi:hypothetical protein AVEN_139433-1 [Araneus ventricosus]|uniref:Uncharacterized protein n=1 Tax=Araneus ventricosus TaxID=182803 RepID=A0A4Y2PXA5_ARAVE|nr:hypothetical protein AVEN_139433-1 [Araneus ventricosus]